MLPWPLIAVAAILKITICARDNVGCLEKIPTNVNGKSIDVGRDNRPLENFFKIDDHRLSLQLPSSKMSNGSASSRSRLVLSTWECREMIRLACREVILVKRRDKEGAIRRRPRYRNEP